MNSKNPEVNMLKPILEPLVVFSFSVLNILIFADISIISNCTKAIINANVYGIFAL